MFHLSCTYITKMIWQVRRRNTYRKTTVYFGNFKWFFLAKTTMFTLDCFGVGRIFFSMSCIFSIFLSRSCKRMTDVKIQNLLRDNRSILRKGLVLHTIAYIRDLHVCICQDLFVNTKVVELRLKALIDEKKKHSRPPSYLCCDIYWSFLYPIF